MLIINEIGCEMYIQVLSVLNQQEDSESEALLKQKI